MNRGVILSDTRSENKVKVIYDKTDLGSQLQDALYAVICDDRYAEMPVSHTVGVLEFLKWNLINRS